VESLKQQEIKTKALKARQLMLQPELRAIPSRNLK